ncbi:hypothetical protein [Lactococcus kimchii]|nr:hypothetical protein [Lactococcus sp. S-13]
MSLLSDQAERLLSIAETAEHTGLTVYQVSTRTAKFMKRAKEIIAQA